MKKLLALILGCTIFGAVLSNAAETPTQTIPAYLQDVSVTIRSGSAEGSGVIFTRKDSKGQDVNFIWTAGHVVADLRSQREVVSPDGTTRTVVEFKDAHILKEMVEDGRNVGRLELDCEIIRFSDADSGEDLALLRVRKKNFVKSTTRFYMDAEIPALGTELYHVGSLLGEMGANSMTSGIYSQQGRLIEKTVFDQTTVAAFPGSSGGGVFLHDGRYVGMLVRGAGETFNLIVPIRRMREWATSARVAWALDPSVAMPSEADLKSLPVEDIGKNFKTYNSASKGEQHFLVRRIDQGE